MRQNDVLGSSTKCPKVPGSRFERPIKSLIKAALLTMARRDLASGLANSFSSTFLQIHHAQHLKKKDQSNATN